MTTTRSDAPFQSNDDLFGKFTLAPINPQEELDSPLYILISDRNKAFFNDEGLKNIIHYAKSKGFKKIVIVVTGSLQKNTQILERLLSGKHFDKSIELDLQKKGLQTERQTTSKTLVSAMEQDSDYEIFRGKPNKDIALTPKNRTATPGLIERISAQLKEELIKANIPYDEVAIPFDRTSVEPTSSMLDPKNPNKRILSLASQLAERQSIYRFQNTPVYSPRHINGRLAEFILEESKDEPKKKIVILPFGCIEDETSALSEYSDQCKKFEKLLENKTEYEKFKVVVHQLALERIKHQHSHLDVALEWVEKYLRKDIPLLLMLDAVDRKISDKTGKKSGHLVYPMHGPLGKLVFQYKNYVQKQMGVNLQNGELKYVNSTLVMLGINHEIWSYFKNTPGLDTDQLVKMSSIKRKILEKIGGTEICEHNIKAIMALPDAWLENISAPIIKNINESYEFLKWLNIRGLSVPDLIKLNISQDKLAILRSKEGIAYVRKKISKVDRSMQEIFSEIANLDINVLNDHIYRFSHGIKHSYLLAMNKEEDFFYGWLRLQGLKFPKKIHWDNIQHLCNSRGVEFLKKGFAGIGKDERQQYVNHVATLDDKFLKKLMSDANIQNTSRFFNSHNRVGVRPRDARNCVRRTLKM